MSMSGYKKTAKDLAFDRERSKLQATIRRRDEEIVDLRKQLDQANAESAMWEEKAKLLETQIGIPMEELLANIKRSKEIQALLRIRW